MSKSRRRKNREAAISYYSHNLHNDLRDIAAQPLKPPAPAVHPIPFKQDHSEFEIQSFLFHRLRESGHQVRGEVLSRCRTCRFDLVVYADGVAKRIIEVKKRVSWKVSDRAMASKARKATAQVKKYAKFGVRVDLVFSMEEAVTYIADFRL